MRLTGLHKMRSQKFVARKNKFNQDARATPSFLSFASVSRLKSAGSSKSCVTPDYRSTSNAAFGVCHERQWCSHHSAQGWSEWTGEELPWVLVQTKYATLTGLYRFSTNTRRSPIASANTGLNDSIPLGLFVAQTDPSSRGYAVTGLAGAGPSGQ